MAKTICYVKKTARGISLWIPDESIQEAESEYSEQDTGVVESTPDKKVPESQVKTATG